VINRYDRNPENSEKRREQSWIWLVPCAESAPDGASTEQDVDANLRVEWAKSRARAACWSEEVSLLDEEMWHVIEFEEWRASWWRMQAHLRSCEPEDLSHGLIAYAERQAAAHEEICYALVWGHSHG
jgi:hypothetical protein